jgi:hypothetical protein
MKLPFLLMVLVLAICSGARAQRIEVPELFSMLDWPHFRIDTTLKKKGYQLMQKDVDSAGAIYQYSHVDRQEQKPTMVRSLVYMDVKQGDLRSRLVNYRTYSEEEFVSIARWLLENGYQTKDKYDYADSKQTVYTNGKETIRVKVITTKIEEGKVFTSYELELGK